MYINVMDFGAKPNTELPSTEAINAAIAEAVQRGGGTVYVPPGVYQIGSIQLFSNITLFIEAGAVLKSFAGREEYKSASLIYAEGARNVAICGKGTIDGNYKQYTQYYTDGRYWPIFKKDANGNDIVYGDEISGFYKEEEWRPRLLVLSNCENISLKDFTLLGSAMWTLHLVDCRRGVINGISIISNVVKDHVQNADGMDFDACSDIMVSDCYIQSSDDAVCLKVTKESGSKTCQNITVTNCVIATDESALKIGSETNGEFKNITFSNCTIRHAGAGIGLWMRDNGVVDGWLISNICMDLEPGIGGNAIFFWAYPRSGEGPAGKVKNVFISNIFAKAPGAIYISGPEGESFENIQLDQIHLHIHGKPSENQGDSQIPTGDKKSIHLDPPDPVPVWSQKNAPYNMFIRNVSGLKMRNVELAWGDDEEELWGGVLRLKNVEKAFIDHIEGRPAKGSREALIRCMNAKEVVVSNCVVSPEVETFVDADGSSENIRLIHNVLEGGTQYYRTVEGFEETKIKIDK